MALKVPILIVVFASTVAAFYLISAMVLLSSIIAWLSLEFSPLLPSALAFVIGLLSLLSSFLAILMVGISHLRRILGFVFLALTVVTLLASIGLLTPYAIQFQTFCNDCDQVEHTIQCVDNCNDECCFTEMSMPLALIFITFSAVSLLTSVAGIAVATAHLFFSRMSDDVKQH